MKLQNSELSKNLYNHCVFILEIVLDFDPKKCMVSKQEKVKDYTGVETQVNSALGHINVTHEFRLVSV